MLGKFRRIFSFCTVLSLPMLVQFAHAEIMETDTTSTTTLPDTTTTTTTTTITEAPPSINNSAIMTTTTMSPSTVESTAQTFNEYYNYLFNNTTYPAWETRTDFFYDFQHKNTPVVGFETIQPLYDCVGRTVLAQGRAGYTDGGTTFNLGLGYRFLTMNKNLMWGINTFFDEIFRYPHRRVGLGGEVYTPFITLRANYYDALSGRHYTGDNTYERASSGFDAGIETPMPYISWMRFTLKGYHWKGDDAPNVNGGLVNLRVYPARQLELAVGYAYDNSQNSQLFINLNYYFGAPDFIQYSASTPHPCGAFTAQDLEKIHLEKVLRTNPIVVEKTQGSSTPVIIARTD